MAEKKWPQTGFSVTVSAYFRATCLVSVGCVIAVLLGHAESPEQ